MEDTISCPLVDASITSADCIENVDVVDGLIVEESMPDRYKVKEDWKEICRKCKFHEL